MNRKNDPPMQRILPAISAILARYPDETDAAPHLRKLAVQQHLRRYRVFAAYRLMKQQREQNDREEKNK